MEQINIYRALGIEINVQVKEEERAGNRWKRRRWRGKEKKKKEKKVTGGGRPLG